MYALLRPLLFLLPPERAHHLTFGLLEAAARIPGALALMGGAKPPAGAAVVAMGLRFPSPVGLAAGMDKDARHVDALAGLGFGFIEVGTLTPKPQPGNPQPRLFRLKQDHALINRMGFNNGGVEAAVERLRHRRPGILLGGNIGKNKDTPNERALDDYLTCFDALHPVVDYFVVNVSSPNTPGLRALQEKGPLLEILAMLKQRATQLGEKPILLKIAPDLTEGQLEDIVAVVKESGIAGVIATNTTVAREGLHAPKAELEAIGAGGLSGAPVRVRSTEVVRYLRRRLPRPLVIIGVGGIDSWAAAREKLEAGADLVQVYTGLVYEGPSLVKRINQAYAVWRT
ncbi:MAG: quinone-dependent dihydroorotate dehydrogenase [Flavobacteriales bacterium]|nr:MAG: quinone-dependent dihydroorotate dehydrogenase [Flavobacteriales bacterium]